MRTVGDAGPYDMDYRKIPPVAEATGGAALGEYKEYYGILLGNVSVGVGAGDPGITTSVVKPLCADRVLVGCVRA